MPILLKHSSALWLIKLGLYASMGIACSQDTAHAVNAVDSMISYEVVSFTYLASWEITITKEWCSQHITS